MHAAKNNFGSISVALGDYFAPLTIDERVFQGEIAFPRSKINRSLQLIDAVKLNSTPDGKKLR